MDAPLVIVWEFQVKSGSEKAFLEAYGPEGAWAQLFRKSPDFVGLELARSERNALRFFTFDTWASREAFESFCQQNAKAYQDLDQKLSGLTEWERRIGTFPPE
jgi:quinol monooxygenase YgiN